MSTQVNKNIKSEETSLNNDGNKTADEPINFPVKIEFNKTPPSPIDPAFLKFAHNPSSVRVNDSIKHSDESKEKVPKSIIKPSNGNRLKFIGSQNSKGPG